MCLSSFNHFGHTVLTRYDWKRNWERFTYLNFEVDTAFMNFFYEKHIQVLKIIQIDSMFCMIENDIYRIKYLFLFCSFCLWKKVNWIFATNLNFLLPISLQLDGVNLWFFKVRLFDLTEFFSLKYQRSVQHWVAKIEGLEN